MIEIELNEKKVFTILASTILFATMFIVIAPTETKADYLDEEGWALIVAPGKIGPDIEKEIQALRNYLINHGWGDDHIIFLIDNKEWTFVDGDATKANIQKGLEYIGKHSTIDETVFIGILDHAVDGGRSTYFQTSYGKIDDKDFAGWIDKITCKEMVIEISSNHAYGFMLECRGDNRLIVCSHAKGQNTEINFYRLSRGVTTPCADTDNNGRISVEEAHAYEKKYHCFKNGQTPISWDLSKKIDVFLEIT